MAMQAADGRACCPPWDSRTRPILSGRCFLPRGSSLGTSMEIGLRGVVWFWGKEKTCQDRQGTSESTSSPDQNSGR